VLRVQLCLWLLVAVPMVPPAFPQSDPAASAGIDQRDGQHDFDFEFGSWKAHIRRLRNPLTGSSDWVEYEGTSVVQRFGTARPTWASSRSRARRVGSRG
jgi:hypothetical protein